MLEGRTLLIAWIAAPAVWFGLGLLGVRLQVSVHGLLAEAWVLCGAMTGIALVAATLWKLTVSDDR